MLGGTVLSACGGGGGGARVGDVCREDRDCRSGLCHAERCLDPESDDDRDGLVNRVEVALGTEVADADSDGDGVDDLAEVGDASAPHDTDGDGRIDAVESRVRDADGDCLVDEADADDETPAENVPALVPAHCPAVGVCAGAGARQVRCTGGTPRCVLDKVVGWEAEEASCDGRDNDCDGATDEDGAGLCDDGDACTADACDPSSGCSHDESCACRADGDCPDDGDPCTRGVCGPDGGCAYEPVTDELPCDLADSCTEGDVCLDGACAPGGWVCDPVTGRGLASLQARPAPVTTGAEGVTVTVRITNDLAPSRSPSSRFATVGLDVPEGWPTPSPTPGGPGNLRFLRDGEAAGVDVNVGGSVAGAGGHGVVVLRADVWPGQSFDIVYGPVKAPARSGTQVWRVFTWAEGAETDKPSGEIDAHPVLTVEADLVSTPGTTAGFHRVPAGGFWMGSPDGESCPYGYPDLCAAETGRSGDESLHYVEISYDFEIQRHEVTIEAWRLLPIAPESMPPMPFHLECGEDCPVHGVSWMQAVAFANAMSRDAGLPECYVLEGCTGRVDELCPEPNCDGGFSCTVSWNGVEHPRDCAGFRLPTEAEWEYAARAGARTATYAGELVDGADCVEEPVLEPIAWYCANSGATIHPALGKEPNALGLHEMLGNVAEWVWDSLETYPASDPLAPAVDPVFRDPQRNPVTRGGSKIAGGAELRAASRLADLSAADRTALVGFRLVRTLSARAASRKLLREDGRTDSRFGAWH